MSKLAHSGGGGEKFLDEKNLFRRGPGRIIFPLKKLAAARLPLVRVRVFFTGI